MAVLLNWVNRVEADGIRVYRSTSPIDTTSPPAPFAVLSADASQYLDSAATEGLYYYAVSAYKGSVEKFTLINIDAAIATEEYSGPVATTIENLRGAWGTVRRVAGYAGPAIKVRDQAGVGPDVDLYFDAGGFVTDPAPYADTRVIRIYDQLVGGHDLIKIPGYGGIYPKYYLDPARYKTGVIDFRTVNADLFRDEAGTSNAYPYMVGDPVLATSFTGINSSGYRAVCGVHRNITAYSHWWSYGFWQDHLEGGLHWSVDGNGGLDATGVDDTTATEDRYSVIVRCNASPARLYLNNVDVGNRTYTAPINYTTTGSFTLGGIALNENRGLGPWIEAFVMSNAETPISVADITAALHECRS